MFLFLDLTMETYVEDYLEENGIKYVLHEHVAVHTVAESRIHCKDIPGLHCKNLFVKDKKTDTFFLIVMPAEKRLQIHQLAKYLGLKKLCFASEEHLWKILKLKAGSVSPLGIINDKEQITKVIVDREVWDADRVSFHPNINTETLEIDKENFHNFIKGMKNKVEIITLDFNQ